MGELPLYQCHKKVRAAKIDAIEGTLLKCSDGVTFHIRVDDAYMAKHKPQVGGYYVVYDDGYESWSPAQAFEEGYTRI